MHTGSFTFARPSIGAWVSYGLGTENQNLPSFVVLAPHAPYAGAQTWGCGFPARLPSGTQVVPGPTPIPNVRRRVATDRLQRARAGPASPSRTAVTATARPDDAALEARIRSFETAFGMQQAAPEAFDLSRETRRDAELYGLERGATTGFAWQCLVARRLVERGVRFIEVIDTGSSSNWDSHGDMRGPRAPGEECRSADRRADPRPQAARLARRDAGRLDDRVRPHAVPRVAERQGREHHHQVFSSWLAGGGVKGGIVHGATDEYGIAVAERPRARPRFPRDDPASARLGSRAADFPPRGPRLPTDRRRGSRGSTNSGLMRAAGKRTSEWSMSVQRGRTRFALNLLDLACRHCLPALCAGPKRASASRKRRLRRPSAFRWPVIISSGWPRGRMIH